MGLPSSVFLPGFERAQAQAILDMYQKLRLRLNDEIQSGLAADRPASTGAKRFYYATDTGVLYFDAPTVGWVASAGEAGDFTISNQHTFALTESHGAKLEIKTFREVLTLTGATTDTAASLLPAGALILDTSIRVTTAVTGTCVSITVGDPITGARFATGVAKALNTTNVGIDHWSGAVTTLAAGPSQAAAAKVRIVGTGGTVTGGVVEIIVHAMVFTAPTS